MMHQTIDYPNQPIRNQDWLDSQLQEIWRLYFTDVEQLNTVKIIWGRTSRTRLGTITGKGGASPSKSPLLSEIRINPLLQNPDIPISVVWQTIAHEVAHYTHGFCSPHPRKYSHPHRGNVIKNELVARNMIAIYIESERWLKKNWHGHVSSELGKPIRKRRSVYGKPKSLSLLSHIRKVVARRYRMGE